MGIDMEVHYENKVHGQSGSKVLKISWIRHLGAMQAWPDLHEPAQLWHWMLQALVVGHSFEQLVWQGTAGAWFIWDAGVVGAAGCGLHALCRWGWCRLCWLRSVVKLEPAVWQLCNLGQCQHCFDIACSQRCLCVWQYMESLLVPTW